MADILAFGGGGRRRHESQGTGSTTNEYVLYLLKSEFIGGAAALLAPLMSATGVEMNVSLFC